jgi:hypothetical protein
MPVSGLELPDQNVLLSTCAPVLEFTSQNKGEDGQGPRWHLLLTDPR